jgi:hypothetical protein
MVMNAQKSARRFSRESGSIEPILRNENPSARGWQKDCLSGFLRRHFIALSGTN